MWETKSVTVLIILTLLITGSFCSAETVSPEPNAAELVRKVRGDENWIHEIDSIYLRIESKWTRTPEGVAARQADTAEQCEECTGTSTESGQDSKLLLSSQGILEYAMDQERVRFFDYESELWNTLTIWDGKRLIAHERFDRKEDYKLNWTAQGSFEEMIAFQTSWLRTQPHSFWWDLKDVDELIDFYGRDTEFTVAGRTDYRGTDCYVLEFAPTDLWGLVTGQSYRCDSGIADRYQFGLIGEARGLVEQSYRWYVGVKDHRLYGLVWLVMGKPHVEHWMSDYKDVAPGCPLPMKQSYALYNRDDDGRHYLIARRDLKVLEVRVNERLPDELFKIEMQKGIQVYDSSGGRQVVYTQRPEPPSLVGKTMPDFSDFQIDAACGQTAGHPVLQCFWDVQQRPSRHCIIRLAERAEQLRGKGITVITVQTSKVDKILLDEWLRRSNIPFTVGMIKTDSSNSSGTDDEQILFDCGVRSLPWLILTDKNHTVTAEGFSISELDEKLEQVDGD